MKVLLDENIDVRLKKLIKGHSVYTVRDKGWFGKQNGQLLELMLDDGFECLITADKNLSNQQNFQRYPISVLVLHGEGIDYASLALLVPKILATLNDPMPAGAIDVRL